MKQFHFNFKDLFHAPRVALSIQRIWINGIGLLAGYIFYFIIAYVSLMSGGYSFSSVWSQMGLLPCAFAMPVPWYSMLIYVAGLFILFAFILPTNTAVSRVIYMTLRDELFYTWSQAFRFALKKWISVLGAMITFLLMIAFFIIAALVMAFIGKIPVIGEIGTALLTIPYIFASLLLFFIVVAFLVSLFFVPIIIATSDEDALGGVFQSFSITFNQPWRILIYGTLVGLLEVIGFFLFGAALKISYHIFTGLFKFGMGEKIVLMKKQALYILDQALPTVYGWAQSLPANLGDFIYLSVPPEAVANIPGSISLAGYILGIFLLIFGGTVVAYAEATGNAGLTLIYIILYKLQEKENLLEREDEELKEEEEEETEEEEVTSEKPPEEGEPKDQTEENQEGQNDEK